MSTVSTSTGAEPSAIHDALSRVLGEARSPEAGELLMPNVDMHWMSRHLALDISEAMRVDRFSMPTMTTVPSDVEAGQAVYSRLVLSIYDAWVLGFSARVAWRCPSSVMLNHYSSSVSGRHLDVGVGTGWFLDRCRWPVSEPHITLLDLNPNSLAAAARRIRRYRPNTLHANVLEPLVWGGQRFHSVSLNFLLHCLPGSMEQKARTAVANLKATVEPGAILFGSTILGAGVAHNALGRTLMRVYNAKGIFCNQDDDADGLQLALGSALQDVRIEVVGTVALFSGRA